MLRRLGWLIGLSQRSRQAKKTLDAKPYVARVKPVLMIDTVQEIAIYIHRFHNLDLFQQGWYQLKITMRWEDNDNKSSGIPSRVVQYEAPDSSSGDSYGVWRIDDKDNSFLTQAFRIKYARQDVRLCTMITFTLPLEKYQGSATCAVILKFELLYSPSMENVLAKPLDASPAAVHEFRIPPKALTGFHSYCPVHFDALHSVLVDVSVHISVLKSAAYRRPAIQSSDASNGEKVTGGSVQASNKELGQMASADKKLVSFVKALLRARDIMLEEMQRLSKAAGQAIDLTEFISTMNDVLLFDSAPTGKSVEDEGSGQGKEQKLNGCDLQSDGWLCSLTKDHLSRLFNLLGGQLQYLWSAFLSYHRDNNTRVMEYLHDIWTKDRRAEWSIWMVYSKVEMPHHFINSGMDESSQHGVHKRVPSLLKSNDPAQVAATRAELHRRSIAQMRINNRSIQDMHIFGDPMRVPIVIIERVWNAPRRTFSDNSYLRHVDMIDSSLHYDDEIRRKKSGSNPTQIGRELKVVIFVHGFQGHHLDLRLIRNQWLLIDPTIEFLMSEANEEKTHGDFREMGQRLAHEVVSFLRRKTDKYARYGRLKNIKLSFVGHSIGNIIIRTAIADTSMEPYRKFLHTYLSLSGPHLGYLYSPNSLFNSGLWILKKLKNTQCIHQLTLTDDPDLRNTFFYKLCKQKTLENFKSIILLSSPQDGYVPYHSARIESCQQASFDNSKRGIAFLEMLNNCMDQIRAPSHERSSQQQQRVFMRCDVNFDTTTYGRNLNSFIGRAAHIEFLESDLFARFIMWSFQDIFR
ncbi:PREDICTED: protein FAM135B-like isoform X2 [Tarenaya hassleriana]|uniref:protein FAM135B-like isoform X2 n=1 Tax=Tarenaya hassleriana TaxID=28532 RepID=UPI00053C237E|nr:PREDICTED: protein FAM135B-like isoform X2 [Tarenaya hassleriana]